MSRIEKRAYNLLVAATGSVAALRIPELTRSLLALNQENKGYYFEVMSFSVGFICCFIAIILLLCWEQKINVVFYRSTLL